jgi:NAD(P)H dehydrogenase (quinone)
MVSSHNKPVILTLGVTGQLGKIVADRLLKDDSVALRVTSRKKEQLAKLKEQYGDAVFMDLDDPRTFDAAIKDVDRLFLLTGYTVDMLVQSKAVIDAAKKAGVKHIVHLGVFTPKFDCYDPHFAWHQMIEAYIKESGIPYTFLHPNCFMQNFTGIYHMAKNGRVRFYVNDKKVGWIALEDVGEASAKILSEGPVKHQGKDYWFSTESLNIQEVAHVFTEVTGKEFLAEALAPEQFLKDFNTAGNSIDPYFVGVADFFKQVVDGRMAYIGDVRDDLPALIGRKGITLKEWVKLHKEELLSLA